MKTIIYNSENLTDDIIDEIVTRVKVFIINSKKEILLANSNGGVQLPGGHREADETLSETIIREVIEETGIVLDVEEIKEPFYEIKYYTKNYKGTNKNRISNVIYYLVESDKTPNIHNIKLTENEKKNNFSINYISINDFEVMVSSVKDNNPIEINVSIAKEILLAFGYLKDHLLL